MKLELDVYRSLCEPRRFTINGIRANYRDFGAKADTAPDANHPNCCGNLVFEPIAPAPAVLAKYGITAREYETVAAMLRQSISFGTCRMCG